MNITSYHQNRVHLCPFDLCKLDICLFSASAARNVPNRVILLQITHGIDLLINVS